MKCPEIRLKNLTNHNVDVLLGKKIHTIPPSGIVVRVDHKKHSAGEISVDGDRISISDYVSEELNGLPDPEPGVMLICSMFVGQHDSVRGKRSDVICPDTYNALRNTRREVVAINGFVRYV